MSQFEQSSHKIVSLLRRAPAFEGQVVHRSEGGVVHEQRYIEGQAKPDPAINFVRSKSRGERADQGILEKTEIEDLGKVYAELKLNLRPREPSAKFVYQEQHVENESEVVTGISASLNTSKIRDMYFKKREEKKMKKLNNTMEKMVKARNQSISSAPTTPGINNKILNFVRTKNRMSYESNNQSHYWEEIGRCVAETNHARAGNHLKMQEEDHFESINGSATYQRANIISLETGLPSKPYIQLSSFRQRIAQREKLFDPKQDVSRKKAKSYSVSMPNGQTRSFTPNGTSIVSTLNEYFSIMEDDQKLNLKRKQTYLPKSDQMPIGGMNQRYHQLKLKVETNEMSLVECCEDFLRTKARKNNQFMNLIQTATRDRPLTQQIRLRLYTGQQGARQHLSQLRRSAEKKRQQLVSGNSKQHKWYENLVEQISRVRDESETLKICEFVFDSLKNILEDGKTITQQHIHTILQQIEDDQNLQMNNISMFLLKKVLEYFGMQLEELENHMKINRFIVNLQREHLQDKAKELMIHDHF